MIVSLEEANEIADKYLDQRWEEFKQLDYYDALWSEHGEPTEKELSNDFKRIIKADFSLNPRSRSGMLIKWFHKSAHKAFKYGLVSPYEYFEYLKTDKETFRKFYINRITRSDWYNEKHGANKHFVYEGYIPPFIYVIGLTTSMKAMHVSMFKPTVAKSLVKKYLDEFDTVFDPFSGYSGRFLGTVALNKIYIGQDLNDSTIEESNELKEFLKTIPESKKYLDAIINSKFLITDSLSKTGEYDCLFTCPPYSDSGNKQIEVWRNSKNEDIECKLTCDEIIEKCLDNYKCKKYVFVVDGSSTKYDKYVSELITNDGYINANIPTAKTANKNYEKIVVIER